MAWGVTDRFKSVVSRSHQVACMVEVLSHGNTIARITQRSPLFGKKGYTVPSLDTRRRSLGFWNETILGTLQVVDGSVDMDRTRRTRRTCSLTVTGYGINPTEANDLLHPASGHELRVWRGVQYNDGTEELVPLGVFRIAQTDVENVGNKFVVVNVRGYDRSRTVSRARFTDTEIVETGQVISIVIEDLVLDRVPWATSTLPPTSKTTARSVYEIMEDPWEKCQNLASALGKEIRFNGLGELELITEGTIGADDPVWQFIEGDDNLLTKIGLSLDDEQTYNMAVVRAEHPDLETPLRGEAVDNDISSPTYIGGDFGVVPVFLSSQFIKTQDEADSAAEGLLERKRGIIHEVEAEGAVLPHLEPGDQVKFSVDGVEDVAIIDTISIPLRASGSMTFATRRKSQEGLE